MITGEIKNRIDTIWDAFWTGGITNSITILEQMTYLFFMKMLDDAQKTKEANASFMGVEVKDPTFKTGMWHNPDTDNDVPYDNLRWSVFKNKEAEEMYRIISRDAFSFIKNLNTGKESAYSRFMSNATFLIQNPRTLVKVVEGIDALDMNNRDTMGDVYEYVLGKMAASGNNGQFRSPRIGWYTRRCSSSTPQLSSATTQICVSSWWTSSPAVRWLSLTATSPSMIK